MRTFSFENKAQTIKCYAWDNVERPLGIIQIAHDECDYSLRYQEFADFFNKRGYIVVSQDLRGFGDSSNGFEHRGEFYGDVFQYSVDDMILLTNLAIAYYKLPVILLGALFWLNPILGQEEICWPVLYSFQPHICVIQRCCYWGV